MSFNTSTGVYSPASGAETAAPGQVVQSATWNGINTDVATSFSQLGQGNAGLPITMNYLRAQVRAIPLSVSSNTSITIPVLAGSSYRVNGLQVSNLVGSASGAAVSLYTGANQTGTVVVGSLSFTIASSTPGASNSGQLISSSTTGTVCFNNTTLNLQIVGNNGGTAATVDIHIAIEPA